VTKCRAARASAISARASSRSGSALRNVPAVTRSKSSGGDGCLGEERWLSLGPQMWGSRSWGLERAQHREGDDSRCQRSRQPEPPMGGSFLDGGPDSEAEPAIQKGGA
jgi:hypothetical protein